eukprot:2622470-Heterocapsa_arctica.AAC.1
MQLVGRVLRPERRQQDREQPRGVEHGCQGDGGHVEHGGGLVHHRRVFEERHILRHEAPRRLVRLAAVAARRVDAP